MATSPPTTVAPAIRPPPRSTPRSTTATADATPATTRTGPSADGQTSGADLRFAAYRSSHDRAERNRLVEDYTWLGRHCARRFRGKGEPPEDLEQVAMVGLVKAVERFEPARGFRFSTYAVPTIMGELRRHFRDRTWSVRVPRSAKDRYIAVKAAVDELQQELQHSPTVAEVAAHVGFDIEETLEALEVGNAYRGVPLDAPDADQADERDTPARRLGADDPGYAAGEARTIVPGLLDALPGDRERRIVELRFVDQLSQSQIAERLGISQVHVSRLLRHSLELMRRRLSA